MGDLETNELAFGKPLTFLLLFKIILKLFKIIYLLLGSESVHLVVIQVLCQ